MSAGYWFLLSGTGLAWMVEGDAAAVLAVLPLVEREVDELSLTIREPAEGQGSIPFSVLDQADVPAADPGSPGCRSQAQVRDSSLVDGSDFLQIRQEVGVQHAHLCQMCA